MRHELNKERLFEIYSKEYDFHFCALGEIDDVVCFLDKYWKKNHILTLSRELLDWQHLDKVNQRYNFSIARHKGDNEIHSLQGFIPLSQFDKNIKTNVLFGAIWKAREDVAPAGLGIMTAYYIDREIKPFFSGGIGLSSDNVRNSEKDIKIMDHYFMPNAKCKSFKIAKNVDLNMIPLLTCQEGWGLDELSIEDYNNISLNSIVFKNVYGMKSKDYYINRYFLHPAYKYHFLAVKNRDDVQAIIIVRLCTANSAKCLRIVDFIGSFNVLEKIPGELNYLLQEENCEYIDFMVSGVDSNCIESAGFFKVQKAKNVIIPNYFEPFLQENRPLNYSYWAADPDYKPVLFKGDADQDRPNLPWW